MHRTFNHYAADGAVYAKSAHLAKELGYFWGGDKVSSAAKDIALCVIACRGIRQHLLRRQMDALHAGLLAHSLNLRTLTKGRFPHKGSPTCTLPL